MSKRATKRSNKAKSMIAQPLFRSRQERPKKGKGSYCRNKKPLGLTTQRFFLYWPLKTFLYNLFFTTIA